ncbi:MAG TPA: hydroxymethylbilane synthase [Solirubrobacterales bacterium]|nr:hydroxymethylbilane synthase [Solirubrobacterales bacterium]
MIRIATRNSALAKAQASQVAELLGGAELVEVSSDGEVGDKGRFVRGVEQALLDGRAELGVHSAKDVPAQMAEGLAIAAVPARKDPADVWVGVGSSLDEVPEGARVGTASLRRQAQLLAARPDLRIGELRGNVDTRLRKLAEGEQDAIVLAAAGLLRLGREDEAAFAIPGNVMIPAAGQGALVLQARDDDSASMDAAGAIGDEKALRELTAERTVVSLLEATCASPIGVHATVGADVGDGGTGSLTVEAFVGLPDGSEWVRDRIEGDADEPAATGALLAERLGAAGGREILERAESL